MVEADVAKELRLISEHAEGLVDKGRQREARVQRAAAEDVQEGLDVEVVEVAAVGAPPGGAIDLRVRWQLGYLRCGTEQRAATS